MGNGRGWLGVIFVLIDVRRADVRRADVRRCICGARLFVTFEMWLWVVGYEPWAFSGIALRR